MSCLCLLSVGCLSALTEENAASTALEPIGLCIMVAAITGVVSLLVWCYSRVLRRPPDDGA